ncbi:MAG: signal recognition particle subunit SRP19/SEC65 family protein [Candidatus Thermoplasmatota archaeon]|nr:signal recognition particle subunit SRP19/SEC65 family protein [Candidatus Thermoplasmatota archaeon]
MVSRHDEKYVLYPAYFDSKAKRPLRRVSTDVAVPSPTAEQVAKACAKLRLQPTLEKGKHHPARWTKAEGRVLVPVRGSKAVLVRQVGEELSKLREALQS